MLAVAGGKGGCGKTTTSVCLGRALASRDGRAVVVDADLDVPDLHVLTGVDPSPGLESVAAGDSVRAAVHRAPLTPGVDVVPAGDASDADVGPALDRLDRRFDRVLVDAPAGASRDAAVPLRAADAVVLVTTPSRRSLTDAAKTAAMARRLDARVVGAIVTRADAAIDPRALLDCPVLARVPPSSDPLADERVADAYRDAVRSARRRSGLPVGTGANRRAECGR